jgi:Zn-dependent protease
MFGSLKVGRPFGIDLSIHPTFWLLPAFYLLTGWAGGGMSAAVVGTALLLAVFACVALHELGHALAARIYGIRTQDITLYPIGGVARLDRIPERPWPEIVIALAGPAVNVVLAAGIAAVLLADGYLLGAWPDADRPANLFLAQLMWSNIFLVVFNLIPAFPMDGGRVLRATLSWVTDRVTATTWAANVGAVFAVLFGIAAVFTGQPMLFILAIALFLMGRSEAVAVRQMAAERRRRQLWDDALFGGRPSRPSGRRGEANEPVPRPGLVRPG